MPLRNDAGRGKGATYPGLHLPPQPVQVMRKRVNHRAHGDGDGDGDGDGGKE